MTRAQIVLVGTLGLLMSVLVVDNVRAEAPSVGGISSDLDRAVTTLPDEKIAYAESSNQEIQASIRIVEKLKETAEREGATNDTLECLKKRLDDMKILEAVAREAEIQMRGALAQGPEAELNFRKIAIAVGKTRGLLAEAYPCSGEETVESGTQSLEVTEPDPFDDYGNFDDNSVLDVVDVGGAPGEETAIL